MNRDRRAMNQAAEPVDDQVMSLDDSRVAAELERYEHLPVSERAAERAGILARYPSIAAALAGCLDGVDRLDRIAPELRSAVGSVATDLHDGVTPPTQLGDFQLVREIGRGGMGVVYEAQQLSLSRRVAIKILPFAAVLDPRHLQRFKNEALAAAHLDHPHIVEVYGVGCERGIHSARLGDV